MAAAVPDPADAQPNHGGPDGGGLVAARPRRRALAALLFAVAGLIDILIGIVAIPTDPYIDIASDGFYHLDITGWGWVRLIVGGATAVAGLALAVDRHTIRVLAIAMGTASIGIGIVMLPYHPLPTAITGTLAAVAIWLLADPGATPGPDARRPELTRRSTRRQRTAQPGRQPEGRARWHL